MRKKQVASSLFKSILRYAFAIFFVLALSVTAINLFMIQQSRAYIFSETTVLAQEASAEAESTREQVVLVLGCAVWGKNLASPMLQDRIDCGVRVFQNLKADSILMSGDRKLPYYDEVGVMQNEALEAGVPSEAIILDPQGYSTFESMLRAKEVYNLKSCCIVTQRYHLYRSVFLARALGIEAYGVAADRVPYSGQLYRDLREIFARCKDFALLNCQSVRAFIS